MVLRWVARVLRNLARQIDEKGDHEITAAALAANENTLLALRMGRLEGKLDIVLAIMGATLFIIVSSLASYFLGVAG